MKYALLVGDGMADDFIPGLNGKTPLEVANTPAMDTIAKEGQIGLVQTVPDGMNPGSDVANMGLLGYDPAKYYTGRAPIEAASMGVSLNSTDVAFRCNLVNIEDGIMKDYSSGHIETSDSLEIIKELQDLNSDTFKFYPGVSYRHLFVVSDFNDKNLKCTPPHDITNQSVDSYIPSGENSDFIKDITKKAHEILKNSPVNKRRIESGKLPVTDIWLWGHGTATKLPTMQSRYGLSGSVISAVDLVRGLGYLAGLNVRLVNGATGYLGTNYAGKIDAAIDSLNKENFVYLHIEAPDETSHEGILEKKIQAIEEFDTNIVSKILDMRSKYKDLRIMTLPDHATCLSTRTHRGGPIPYTVCGMGIREDSSISYSERSAQNKIIIDGVSLFDSFIKKEIWD